MTTEEAPKLERHKGWWTYDPEADAYYFAPLTRAPGPYKTQRQMRAIVDVASDGTMAGIELQPMTGATFEPPATPSPSPGDERDARHLIAEAHNLDVKVNDSAAVHALTDLCHRLADHLEEALGTRTPSPSPAPAGERETRSALPALPMTEDERAAYDFAVKFLADAGPYDAIGIKSLRVLLAIIDRLSRPHTTPEAVKACAEEIREAVVALSWASDGDFVKGVSEIITKHLKGPNQ